MTKDEESASSDELLKVADLEGDRGEVVYRALYGLARKSGHGCGTHMTKMQLTQPVKARAAGCLCYRARRITYQLCRIVSLTIFRLTGSWLV